jgi:DNA polymerase-3 subunit gamma/tau
MAYQSLYRRYRPQRFGEVRGQDHVSVTLRNAVRDGRVAHAYLFSGPRGTGKTSTARILAKALNCTNPTDGEPCGVCGSCVEIAEGRSLDVLELDAASNRGVDAMRDLVSRAALGTPGRWKVYIVDEVHMLTTEASNTLLKTLEEPPGHVVFVLATTEPQKVLPTIRSRTQHFEFRLLPADLLAEHLRWVADDAGLEVASEAIDLVARRGSGSARDALSALDQVAAAGGIEHHQSSSDEVVEALCEPDLGRALAAVAEGCGAGQDIRHMTTELLEHLRQAFLATVSRGLVGLPDDDLARVENQARRLGRAATVRAMEVLGDALVQMRDAPEPRVLLEVALVRLCRPEADTSPSALLERIERLERALSSKGGPPTPAPAAGSVPRDRPAEAPAPSGGLSGARMALGGVRRSTAPAPPPPAEAAPRRAAPAPEPPATPFPTREELTLAWGDHVLPALPNRARSRFRVGRFVAAEGDVAAFALPNVFHRDRCEEVRADVERALGAHFGRPVPLRLLVEAEAPAAVALPVPDDEPIDPEELRDAPAAGVVSPLDHVMQAFEGATVVEE